MAACDEKEWDIRLKIDGGGDEEAVLLTNIQITGGVIIGEVRDRDHRLMSYLRGLCRPAIADGHADMSHLEFIFNVRDAGRNDVMLRLEGVGYLPLNGKDKEFRGEFRAYERYRGEHFSIQTAPATELDGQLHLLRFDEGDTGTGTGQQT